MSNNVGPGTSRPGLGLPDSLTGPVAVFTATMFISALLLFSIQPLFAKMVLPLLGGAPSVWAVALCFFQGALLAGYCYAHLLNHHVPERWAGAVHLGLTALAMMSLPIGVPAGWREPPPGDPYLWQLGLFTIAIGLPFLAVSANAPLLQAWFARTGHPQGRDPYFLYAASNLGSFIALLAYPLILEPAFGVSALSRVWTIGFVLLWLALAICFLLVRQSSGVAATTARDAQPAINGGRAPGWRERLTWIGLAMVPSGLLTAYTNHIATDVASAPLIWVIPLSLYLLTFVVVFREKMIVSRDVLLWAHLVSVVLALWLMSQLHVGGWYLSAAIGVAAFFLSGLVAHRTLYEARPAAGYLTQFYLFMSLGGVLGGLFAALLAPQLFSEVLEYPILLALTMACRPGALDVDAKDGAEQKRLALMLGGGLALIAATKLTGLPALLDSAEQLFDPKSGALSSLAAALASWLSNYGVTAILALGFAYLVWHYRSYPVRQMMAAFLICAAVVMLPSAVRRGSAERSYFGVYRVSSDGTFNVLSHGTTVHGAQRVRDDRGKAVVDTTPGTYYHPKGPMAVALDLTRQRLVKLGRAGARYGIVGLGAGSLACYARPGEAWRFYEIDPVVVRIAKDTRIFTFMEKCQPNADVVLGDARLTLAKEPSASYDLLIIDAFSSDAVPVHLLTAEALRMYVDKLAPDGVLVLHISNRYLDLDGVVAATKALIPGLDGVLMSDDEDDGTHATAASTAAVLSRSKDALAAIRAHDLASEFEPTTLRGWTDDYSDILGPFIAKMRQGSGDEDE